MRKINILSKNIYNRIAAGEVVDRPYSAVKELVENSIDAGATDIEIYIENGGKHLIKVIDNGSGIFKEDLRSAFLPHATSKISSVQDLDSIKTLGFRGEALASISVVSKVELVSKAQGESQAYSIRCEEGNIGQVMPSALDQGTSISVYDLFFNTPVRQKFLKTDKKEEADITAFVSKYILSHSEISFKYYADNKLIMQSFGGGLDEAMVQIYGAKTVSSCYKIDGNVDEIRVYGYIGNQNFFKPNKTYQSLFINGRYIVNNNISIAMMQAYSNYLMKRQYPFYVLFIEMPTDMVDVNVHPNKADVRFADTRQVFSAVHKIVSSVLDGIASAADFVEQVRIPEIKSTADADNRSAYGADDSAKTDKAFSPKIANIQEQVEVPFVKYVDKKPEPKPPRELTRKNMAFGILKEDIPFREDYDNFFEFTDSPQFGPINETYKNPGFKKGFELNLTDEPPFLGSLSTEAIEYAKTVQEKIEDKTYKYKGSMFNTYLIFELDDDVILVDQHAAHERMIYDSYVDKLNNNKSINRQLLMYPEIIATNSTETVFVEDNLDFLRSSGFGIEKYGPQSFRIYEIPADLHGLNVEAFFNEILRDVHNLKKLNLAEVYKDKLAMTACKNAIKGGYMMKKEEIDKLLEMLDGNFGLKCPHGRPVCVRLTKKQVEKMFKRIV